MSYFIQELKSRWQANPFTEVKNYVSGKRGKAENSSFLWLIRPCPSRATSSIKRYPSTKGADSTWLARLNYLPCGNTGMGVFFYQTIVFARINGLNALQINVSEWTVKSLNGDQNWFNVDRWSVCILFWAMLCFVFNDKLELGTNAFVIVINGKYYSHVVGRCWIIMRK